MIKDKRTLSYLVSNKYKIKQHKGKLFMSVNNISQLLHRFFFFKEWDFICFTVT